MEKENYWIIPIKVLFDNDLSDKQKLLYCYISSLTKQKWYCFALNNTIATKLWVTKNTISKNINILEKKHYFRIENPFWNNRKIYIEHNEKSLPNIIKNRYHNNINNNINEYIEKDTHFFEENIEEELKYIIEKRNELFLDDRSYNFKLEEQYKQQRLKYTYEQIKKWFSTYYDKFDIKNNDKKYLLWLNKFIIDDEKGFINYL